MNRKAFTLMELLLVVAIMAIFAASSIPYLMQTFGGFNKITSQEAIINTLQECSTVISRRIIFDNLSASKANLDNVISSLTNNNGITIIVESSEAVKDKNGTATDIAKIVLKGTNSMGDTHKISFLVCPASL